MASKYVDSDLMCVRSRTCWECEHLMDWAPDVAACPISCWHRSPKPPWPEADLDNELNCPNFEKGLSRYHERRMAI